MPKDWKRDRPPWLITDPEAVETELGVLKTGKEADAYLIERSLGPRLHLLVAKRYRDPEHRTFRNDALYRAGRRTGDRRIDLAVHKGTRAGMRFRAWQWAEHEFRALSRLWEAGVAVPYPISCGGTELKMEFVGEGELPAPRLVDAARAEPLDYEDLWRQCLDALRAMAACGIVHADLSPYNLLVLRGRLFVIDLPQSVEIGVHDQAMDLLLRDVRNTCRFFMRRGVECDAEEAFAELVSLAPWP
jgi:RIO kinase 1